ncbi:MAG: rhomboid family intramembrane serine protease [Bacteroidales bacterium]
MNLLIIIATGIISFIAFNNKDLFDRLKFNAYEARHSREYYRFFSYGLVHADIIHLVINMFVLYSFGRIVESHFVAIYGTKTGIFIYVFMYVAAIAISTLSAFGKHKDNPYYNAVGASGAVSAVVFASILLAPYSKIAFILLPIPIPSPVFGLLYLAYSAYMGRRSHDNIGHDAHFWGALFGFFFPVLLKPDLFSRFFELLF